MLIKIQWEFSVNLNPVMLSVFIAACPQQMVVAKNIMNKIKILEELFEMNVHPDDIHWIRDIYCLSNTFLCNLLDYVYVDFNYLKHNL